MKRTLALFLSLLLILLQLSGCTNPENNNPEDTTTESSKPDESNPQKTIGRRIWDQDHPDDSTVNGYFSVTLKEIPNVTFTRNSQHIICANDAGITNVHGYCTGFYTYDFTNDGIPELCFNVSFGSGMCDQHITIIDYTTQEAIFDLWERGNYDYYLFLRDGALCVKETRYASDEALRTGILLYSDGEISVAWDDEVQFTPDRDVNTTIS